MTDNRSAIYFMSAVVGVLAGAFGMLMFMFDMLSGQAALHQRMEDHISEWRDYHSESVVREAQCEKERKEIVKMIYEIREELRNKK